MKINTYEFRPKRAASVSTIIGFLVYRGFEDLGNGVCAPVYAPNKKLELKRVLVDGYTDESIQEILTKVQQVIHSLRDSGCIFSVALFDRSKTTAAKDSFGKYSENQVAEIYYQELSGYNEKDEAIYNKPQSFNTYILTLLETYGERS